MLKDDFMIYRKGGIAVVRQHHQRHLSTISSTIDLKRLVLATA